MSRKSELVRSYPEAAGRAIFTLAEFAGDDGDIDDPAQRGEEAFRFARDRIRTYLAKSIDRLSTLSRLESFAGGFSSVKNSGRGMRPTGTSMSTGRSRSIASRT